MPSFHEPRLVFVHNNNVCTFHYRPQRSCGKGMFSQASAILFTGGVPGVSVGGGGADTPLPGQTPPGQTPQGQTPLPGTHPKAHTPRAHTPLADTPGADIPRQTHHSETPLEQTPQAHTPHSPQQTATAADGTHPTGMHSCSECKGSGKDLVIHVQ